MFARFKYPALRNIFTKLINAFIKKTAEIITARGKNIFNKMGKSFGIILDINVGILLNVEDILSITLVKSYQFRVDY